jgi:hypothetical protein
MSSDDDLPEVSARDAIEIAQRALAKVNDLEREIDELRETQDELDEELTGMELRLSEQDEERSYDSLTRDEKVGMVREHAFEKATAGTGRAKLDYDDVVWEIFDGEASADHAYKLMRLAAEGARGFEYRDAARPKALAVNATEAKKSLAFSSANKTTSGGGSL